MGFAADAVLDVVTPQPRQPARAPEAANNGPTFDDHLQAAARDSDVAPEPEVLPAPNQPPSENVAEATDPATSLLGGEVAPVTPPAQQIAAPTAAPVLLQLITSTVSPAQPDHAKPQTVTPTAPTQPPPGDAAAAASITQPAAAGANGVPKAATPAMSDAAPTEAATPTADKSTAPVEKSVAPAANPQTAPAPVQTQQTAPTIPIPVMAIAALAPSIEVQTAPGAIAAAQAPAPEHAARQSKAALMRGEAKSEPPKQDHAAAFTPTAPPRSTAKAATPQGAAKDAAVFAPLDAPGATPAQQTSFTASAAAPAATSHAQHAAAEENATRAAPAAQQIAREIVRRFEGGSTRFELRLDPPELGRIEVKLEVSRDHRVTAVIAADSPQALTDLARHARELEQMLQGAGLELSDNGLSFDLRQGGEHAGEARESGAARSGGDASAHAEDAAPIAARPIGYERWRGVRLDVMV